MPSHSGAAQGQVGERWMRNEWTVADEHLADGLVAAQVDEEVMGALEHDLEAGQLLIAEVLALTSHAAGLRLGALEDRTAVELSFRPGRVRDVGRRAG